MFDNWLQAIGKLDYARKKNHPNVECILCAIRDNDERVKSLKFYQNKLIFCCLNVFPYNSAHSLIATNRHITLFTELTKEEILIINRTIQGLQILFDDLFCPEGYNIGINQGEKAGASISHLHFHLVPRYGSELGFIDIVGKSKIVLEGLQSVLLKIKENVNKFLNDEFFKEFKKK